MFDGIFVLLHQIPVAGLAQDRDLYFFHVRCRVMLFRAGKGRCLTRGMRGRKIRSPELRSRFQVAARGGPLETQLRAGLRRAELRPANLPRQVETDFLCPFRPLQFRSLQLPFCARFHRTGVLRLRRGTRHGIPT